MIRHLLILLNIVLVSGCTSLSYYGQSIHGQFEVLQNRQPIGEVLNKNNITNELREKLKTVLLLRKFSVDVLSLPENKSYLSYSELNRDYVIWNIFANKEFSLEPETWCYLIVGCLSYRGYFSQLEAEQHAKELEHQGYDIYIGGVSAYSTLGWFDDPVLNTMLRWDETYLATVIFHELAHQQLYIKDDTEFNESYADAVAHIGVTLWLTKHGDNNQLVEYQQSQQYEEAFVKLIKRYKLLLNNLYHSDVNEAAKRQSKNTLLIKMTNEYMDLTKRWGKNPYKEWFSTINNAKLASVVTYRKYVPAFLDIYEKLEKDLAKFYSFSKSLSNCNLMKRKEILKSRKIEFEC
jgi:predicted aminopeptidase